MYTSNNNNNENSIPKKIYQTWHSTKLPVGMYNSIVHLKKINPEFQYYLFNDNDCREFIKKHYDRSIVDAFDKLIPGAYKADLWRYCILYKLGGIYIDIKYTSHNDHKFIHLIDKEHFVLDCDKKGIYNAFMICKPGNTLLLDCIHQIVMNVKNKYYGTSFLEPTGPKLLYKKMKEQENRIYIKNIDMSHSIDEKTNDKFISFSNETILVMYKDYLYEREKYKNVTHYSLLWQSKNIYR
jgi:mannosyltransferase OCH1-like enzyme